VRISRSIAHHQLAYGNTNMYRVHESLERKQWAPTGSYFFPDTDSLGRPSKARDFKPDKMLFTTWLLTLIQLYFTFGSCHGRVYKPLWGARAQRWRESSRGKFTKFTNCIILPSVIWKVYWSVALVLTVISFAGKGCLSTSMYAAPSRLVPSRSETRRWKIFQRNNWSLYKALET
jgi:hypothetical protein